MTEKCENINPEEDDIIDELDEGQMLWLHDYPWGTNMTSCWPWWWRPTSLRSHGSSGGNCFLASSVASARSLGTSTGLDHLGEYGDRKAIVRRLSGLVFLGQIKECWGGNHAKARWRSILNLHDLLNYAVVHVGTLKFQCPARNVANIGVVQGHWSNVGLRDGGFLPEAIRWVPV